MRGRDSLRRVLLGAFFLCLIRWVFFGLILYLFLRFLLFFFLYWLRWLGLSWCLGRDLRLGGIFGDFEELLNAKCQKVVFNLKIKTVIKALLVETVTYQTSHGSHLGVWDGDTRHLLRYYHRLSFL